MEKEEEEKEFEIPYELDFNLRYMPPEKEAKILEDWDCITYNDYYSKNAKYIIESRFRCEYDHIPGFDKVIDLMIKEMETKTPLDEYNERIKNKE